MSLRLVLVPLLLASAAPTLAAPSQPAPPAPASSSAAELQGLLPVRVDKAAGRVWLVLPPPDAEGLSGRFIYLTTLETGLGSEIGRAHV